MRLDKYLKVSRIIKRRPVAKEVADKGRIKVNGILAKSSTDLKINDQIEVRFGKKMLLKCMKLSVRQGLKKMSRNIVQINNRFIQDENQRRRYLDEERRKRNRFMGWVLILVMLLFILPAYNLYQSYETLLNRRAQYAQLQKKYEKLGEEKSYQSDIATKLKDDSYAAKYARAKYSFSKEGEYIYTTPDLLPQ